MRFLTNMFAIIGLLSMAADFASRIVRTHPSPSYTLQSAPFAPHQR
jgi:hypothetical protein